MWWESRARPQHNILSYVPEYISVQNALLPRLEYRFVSNYAAEECLSQPEPIGSCGSICTHLFLSIKPAKHSDREGRSYDIPQTNRSQGAGSIQREKVGQEAKMVWDMKKNTLRQIKVIIISPVFSWVSVCSDLPGSFSGRNDGREAEGAQKAPASAILVPGAFKTGRKGSRGSCGARTAEWLPGYRSRSHPGHRGWTGTRGPGCGVYSLIKHQTSHWRKNTHRLSSRQPWFTWGKRFFKCP